MNTSTKPVAVSKHSYSPEKPRSDWKEATLYVTAGTQVSVAVVAFSLNLPFLFTPSAALNTFQFASWAYDDALSHFDNTYWTYGTDYALGIAMWLLTLRVPKAQGSRFRTAGWLSRGLLICYLLSVLAGAIAHQFFTSTEARNTLSFRYLWTICVGTVAAGSGFMGATATALHRLDQENAHDLKLLHFKIPLVQEWFWVGYTFVVSAMVALGSFSCQRPACDIFIVGITQFPSTFYMMLLLRNGLGDIGIKPAMRVLGCLGFILNAPLLPLYPILVHYTNWSLASVNTLLHSWLLVAWSLQGLTLRHVGKAVVRHESKSA